MPVLLCSFKFLNALLDPIFSSQATKDKLKLEEEYGRRTNYIQKLTNTARSLQQQIQDAEDQHARSTQVWSVCYIGAATV